MDAQNRLMCLSREEHEELLRVCAFLLVDDKTKNMAVQYLADYKLSTHGLPQKTLPILAKCAVYVAEKSQSMFNLKGEKIHGMGLSLNQIIKSFGNIEEFVGALKDFIKNVRVHDRQAEADINLSIKRISFGITFHSKFEKTIKKLDFVERVNESYGYIKTFTSFLWLLFIDARSRIYSNNQDVIENTCLLVSVFYFMIRYSIDYITSQLFSDVEKNQDKKVLICKITEKLLELFLIEDYETYRNVVSSFDDYFDQLVQNNIIKHTQDRNDFFSPELINLNYKRLDAVYQKKLLPDDLDERFFLKERITTLTPSKLTPFARQGYNSKALVMKIKEKEKAAESKQAAVSANPPDRKEYSSHRELDYEVSEKDLQANLAKLPNNSQLNFPKNVMFSPSITRTPLICATPLTMGMQMYNYLHEKPRAAKDMTFKLRKYEQHAAKWIERIVLIQRRDNPQSLQEKKTREIRFNIIYALYKIAVEEYYSQNGQEKETEEMHKALIALAAETVCFVCNVINMTFRDITEPLGLKFDVLFKANDFFMKFDKSMPIQIRSHFQDLETQIVSSDIWRDSEMVTVIERYSKSDFDKQPKPVSDGKEKLVKKILTQAALQISSLGAALRIDDRLCEQVFATIKHILGAQTEMMYNRHLDQMVLCSMYAICKTNQIDAKFNDIKLKYEECSLYNKAMHQDIICGVYISDNIAKVDIIKFYNTVFISKLKIFITSLKDLAQQMRGYAPVYQCTLKQLSTKEVTQCYKRTNKMRSQFTPVNLDTPSYLGQRPMAGLTSQPLISKKTINFEQGENNFNMVNNGRTVRHFQQDHEDYQSRKPREFRDLRPNPNPGPAPVILKQTSKREKDLNNTPRMNNYASNFHNICDTEKMKFNK